MLSFSELLSILFTIITLGIIFAPDLSKESIIYYSKVAGISVILHELAHRMVAIALGYQAYYRVNLWGLLLGLILKFGGSPVILFVPGYVVIPYSTTPLDTALISIAGPLTNLILYIISYYMSEKSYSDFWHSMKTLNLWLFVFNMLPIPPLDGYQFIHSLFSLIPK